MPLSRLSLALLLVVGSAPASLAADLSAREVTERLYRATSAAPVDFKNLKLDRLDLAGLDFKGAHLERADLFGTDLSGVNLANASLAGARLDRVVIIGARFDGADLSGASVLRPTAFTSFDRFASEAPSFTGANLKATKLFGVLSGASFAHADMTGAVLAPDSETGFIEVLWRTELVGSDLSGANLEGADLTHVSLRFANLRGANLAHAKLRNADLSHADFTGADLSHADVSGADLDSAILTGAKGLDSVAGLATAPNRDKAVE